MFFGTVAVCIVNIEAFHLHEVQDVIGESHIVFGLLPFGAPGIYLRSEKYAELAVRNAVDDLQAAAEFIRRAGQTAAVAFPDGDIEIAGLQASCEIQLREVAPGPVAVEHRYIVDPELEPRKDPVSDGCPAIETPKTVELVIVVFKALGDINSVFEVVVHFQRQPSSKGIVLILSRARRSGA